MNRLLIAFAALIALSASVDSACTYTDSTGCFYDLSQLNVGAPYYTYTDTEGVAAGDYTVNVCGAVEVPGCAAGSAVCQTDLSGSPVYSCGMAANFTFADYQGDINENATCQGVQITYVGGDSCVAIDVDRTSIVNIGCSETYAETTLISVEEDDLCEYTLQMFSPFACGNTVATFSATTSPVASPVVVPSASATNVASPVAEPSLTSTTSASVSSGESLSNTASVSPSLAVSAPATVSAAVSSVGVSVSASVPSVSAASVMISPPVSPSEGASMSASNTTAATPAESSSGSNAWIYWVLGGIVILVIVIAVVVGGFMVYKKKQQQSYDSIGYE